MNFPYEDHFIVTNGVTLHVVQAGPLDGPVALLLHGFPDFWASWTAQVDHLVQAGYRVWIPDQRGYNESEKPPDIDSYHINILADDVCGLISSTGNQKVTLLGHDWGGAVSWWLAHRNPDLIDRLIIINSAHFSVILHYMKWNLRQLARSWYMYFFRIPFLPEYLLRRRNYQALTEALTKRSQPNTFSATDLDRCRAAWSQPGALKSMINWYRALMRDKPVTTKSVQITVPTLLIWGSQDHALGQEMAQPSIDLCDQGELRMISNAGHWVHREASSTVNRYILEFLSKK